MATKIKRDLTKYRNEVKQSKKLISLTHPELPPFSSFIENTNKGIRFFFEPAQDKESANSRFHPNLSSVIGAGEFSERNKKTSFYPIAVEKLGKDNADLLARMVVKYLQVESKWSSLSKLNSSLTHFCVYLEVKQQTQLLKLSVQTIADYREYLANIAEIKNETYFNLLKTTLLGCEYFNKLGISSISWQFKKTFNPHDIDIEVAMDYSYSDRVMTQILAYVFYEIESMTNSILHIRELSPEYLGENYLDPSKFEEVTEPAKYFYDDLVYKILSSKSDYKTLYENCLYDDKFKAKDTGRFMQKLNRMAKQMGLANEYKEFNRNTREKGNLARKEHLSSITKSKLGSRFMDYDKFSVKVAKPIQKYEALISKLLSMEIEGFEILKDNVLLYLKGEPKRTDWLVQRIRKVAEKYEKNEQYKAFLIHLRKEVWGVRERLEFNEGKVDKLNHAYYEFMSGQTPHFAYVIGLYECITYGVNREVVLNTAANINGESTLKNFDKFLGADGNIKEADKAILLEGVKKRGSFGTVGKNIPISVNVKSPFYNYLTLLNSLKSPERKLFYDLDGYTWQNYSSSFARIFPIYADDGTRLQSIEVTKFRKVFAGHKLLSVLDNVTTESELISNLQDALHHENFDTTIFSYLLKSGKSNDVINSAIVALSTELLESAIAFKGKIVVRDKEQRSAVARYLCDCSDPTSPTPDEVSGLAYCKRFDLCLGCERSRVYASHLPKIAYRILQYEQTLENNPDMYHATLSDKHAVALDTLRKFKITHPEGEKLVDDACIHANECWGNGDMLIPHIFLEGGL